MTVPPQTSASTQKSRPSILARSVAVLLGVALVAGAQRALADQYWDGPAANSTSVEGGTGTWDQSTLNWTNAAGTTNSIYDPNQPAIFGVTGGTVTLGASLSFTNLTFTVSGYTITSGMTAFTLSPTGTAILNAQTGVSATISAKLTGVGGISLTGGGTIILSGSNAYTGGTTLNNGSLFTDSNSALGTGTLTITSSGGATTLGTNVQGTTLTNNISVLGDFSVSTGTTNRDFYLNGNVDLNGGTRTITGLTTSEQVHFGGTISNGAVTYRTTFTAPGDYAAFIMDSATPNTYTGLTTVGNGAFLVFQGTTPNGAIQGDVLVEGNGVVDYLGGSSSQIADTATVTVNSAGNTANGIQFTGLDLFSANGTEVIGTLNGNGTVGLANSTLSVGAGNFSGVISDGFHTLSGGSLTKTGAGTLTLSGANTYTGATSITDGKLVLTGAGALGDRTAVNLTGATAIFDLSAMTATSDAVGSLAGVAGSSVVLGGKNLTAGGNNANTSFAGVLSGLGGSFTKTGTGTMTLTGTNTYTGATSVNGGTLIVDISTNPTVLSSSSMLALGGGTFRLTGSSGGVRTQIMDGLTVNAGSGAIVIDNGANAAGTMTTLDLRGTGGGLGAGITQHTGGTVDFSASAGATFATDAIVLTGQQNDASGILGAWATLNHGAVFAANDGSGKIVAYTGYVAIDARGPQTIADGPNTNLRIENPGTSGPVVIAAPTTNINTLTQGSTTASTIDTSPGTLRFGVTGGVFITPGNASLTIGTAPNSGMVTAGGNAANVAGDLIVGNFSTTGSVVTINSAVVNNGTGVVSLTKTGAGMLTLAGTNTYTGATTIGAGTLTLTGAGSLADSTDVNLTGSTSVFDISGITATGETIGSLAGVTGSSVVLGSKNLTAGGTDASTALAGVISGSGGSFTKVGAGTMTLSGANTYDGTTTVTAGTLNLDTIGANAISGNVVVNGGNLVLQQSNQISDSRTVSVSAGSMNIGSHDETVAGVQLLGGSIDGTTGVLTSTSTYDVQSGSISANLSGFVGLTKTTAGTVTLSGQDNYSGPTNVNGGKLVVAGVILSPVTVTNASEFDVTATGGVGVGAGVTVVTATDGNVVNNAGILQGGNGSTGINAASNNKIVNSGSISGGSAFKGIVLTGSGNTATNRGAITGDKAVVLTNASGSNAVVNFGILTGTSGVAIDATGSGGKLAVINDGAINGDVRFGSGNDVMTLVTGHSVAGLIDGGGGNNILRLVGGDADTLDISGGTATNFSTLIKRGGGRWTLTGTGAFSGGTTVEMGNLYVEGNLISNVHVLAEGFLGGSGVITGAVWNAGTLNPGNSPGTMTVQGDYTQSGSGTLVIEMAGKKSGQYDRLVVQGRAHLDGTLRLVQVDKGPRLRIGEQVTFLTASRGVEGRFSNVINPFTSGTMVISEVVYENNAMAIAGAQGSYVEFAKREDLTLNQRAVARVVDAAAFGGKEHKMVDYLNNRLLDKIPGDLNRIAPEELAAVYRVGVALADVQARNVERRMEDLRLTSRRPSTSTPTAGSGQLGSGGVTGPNGEVGKNVAPAEPQDRWGVFFTGVGEVTKVGRTENARGYELNSGGVTVGLDYKVTPNFALGLSMGYVNTSANLADDGKLLINGGKLGAYATYFTGGFHADAAVNSGFNSYETRRSGLDGTARGRTDGLEWGALAGAGYDWKPESFTLGPTATVQYTYVGIDEFTEHGSLAPLRVPGQHAESIRSTLGFKTAYDWNLGRMIVRPEIRLAWQHEYGDRSFALDSELDSGAGGIFRVQDSETGRDSLLLSAGVSVLWSASTLLYLSYDGELGRKEYEAHNLTGGMRLTF